MILSSDQDQDTRLRMPNKWDICKEGQAGKKMDNAACFCFLNYLAFLRPAADQAVWILPLVASRGRSNGFLWAGSIIQKNWGRASNSSLFACKRWRRLTAFVVAKFSSTGYLHTLRTLRKRVHPIPITKRWYDREAHAASSDRNVYLFFNDSYRSELNL
jgi:hypothetical protein